MSAGRQLGVLHLWRPQFGCNDARSLDSKAKKVARVLPKVAGSA